MSVPCWSDQPAALTLWRNKLHLDPDYSASWKFYRCSTGNSWQPKERHYAKETAEDIRREVKKYQEQGIVRSLGRADMVEEGTGVEAFCGHIHRVLRDVDGVTKKRFCLDPDKEALDSGKCIFPTVSFLRSECIRLLKAGGPDAKLKFVKIDLKTGYWQMKAKPESRHRFVLEGEIFEWLVMPFGPSDAPQAFQRRTSAVAKFIGRSFNSPLSVAHVYLDDFIFISVEPFPPSVEGIKAQMQEFGLTISEEKSSQDWETVCVILGVQFDGQDLRLRIPEYKISRITKNLSTLRQAADPTARQVAVPLGRLNACAQACPIIHLHTRGAFIELAEALKKEGIEIEKGLQSRRPKDWDKAQWDQVRCRLSEEAFLALEEALALTKEPKAQLRLGPLPGPDALLMADAGAAQGGYIFENGTRKTEGIIELPSALILNQKLEHSAAMKREAFVICQAASAVIVAEMKEGETLIMCCDNKGLSHRWDKGVRDREVSTWLRNLARLALQRNVFLRFMWIPRENNARADELSKLGVPACSQIEIDQLSFDAFIQRLLKTGKRPPNLDWFASEKNAKLSRFRSLEGRLESAFGRPLEADDVPYAFSPLHLFQRAVQVWRESPSTLLYLVVPQFGRGEAWRAMEELGESWGELKPILASVSRRFSYRVISLRK